MEEAELSNTCVADDHKDDSSFRKDGYIFRWKPFLRQMLICSGVWVSYFMLGLSMGAPTVFIPQIRREANSTNIIDQEMASWLSSLIPYSGMPCAFILPALTQLAGRRKTVLLLATTTLVGYIILLSSTTVQDLLISEAMYGFLAVSCHTILPIIITECTLSRYRGIFLTLKTASFYFGIWVSNAIGTFFYWKYIAYLGIVCNVYVFVAAYFFYESPYWLATKGRYEECIESHRFLKGNSSDAEFELRKLLMSQKLLTEMNFDTAKRNNICVFDSKTFFKSICNEELYKPTLVSLLMMTLYHSSGKIACTIYAIELIKRITKNESTAYKGMLILDGVTLFGMFVGCILARFLKRRTLMIGCSSLGVIFLTVISVYLYSIRMDLVLENSITSIILLTFYQLSISSGPILLSSSIYSEMVPMKFINYSMFAMGLYSVTLMASVIKFSPLIFTKFGLHSAFLFYSICTAICTFLVYKYLPETKDKTPQEIEEYFKKSCKENRTLLSVTRK